jgi:hypothetical protein
MFAIIAVSWIAIICLSLGWNRHQVTEFAIRFAESEASASYNKDLAYRRWSAIQGGVYVPPTDKKTKMSATFLVFTKTPRSFALSGFWKHLKLRLKRFGQIDPSS